jgi:hypothetical protein
LSGTPINTNLISNSQFNTSLRLSVDGNDLFVLNNEVISEYTTDGTLLISNLLNGIPASAMAASGGNLFVSVPIGRGNTGNIEQYTTAGAQVNPSLGMPNPIPENMTVSGDNVFVESNPLIFIPPQPGDPQWIGEFSSAGAAANPNFISTMNTNYYGVAVIGNDIFTSNFNTGTVWEFSSAGTLLNASFISLGGHEVLPLASGGNDLFVSGPSLGSIGEYDATGAAVNANLITGLAGEIRTITIEVPEPGPLSLFALCGSAFIYHRRQNQQSH